MPISRILSRKKRKLVEIITHYHSFSLVVIRCTTRCHSLFHSLLFDVSLVCLFINDLKLGNILSQFKSILETNGKKQTHIWFSFYIQLRYCNLILKNYWTWAWKNSDYLTGLGLTLWYIRLGIEKYSTILLHSAWSYDILDLTWKLLGLPYWS